VQVVLTVLNIAAAAVAHMRWQGLRLRGARHGLAVSLDVLRVEGIAALPLYSIWHYSTLVRRRRYCRVLDE
jgi:hypothetical protein